MRGIATAHRVLAMAATLTVLGTVGCGIIDPCDRIISRSESMKGNWQLTSIDGNAIPAAGYPLPTTTDRLKAGFFVFQANTLTGSCNEGDEIHESGNVYAVYTIVDALGNQKPAREYAGSYSYEGKTGVVTLEAFGKSIDGNRYFDEFNVKPNIPFFGSYRLEFTKYSN
jgi:hypothetical protein